MHISPSNVSEITLALFYITSQEVRKKHMASALDLMDKLSYAWYQTTQPDHYTKTTKIKKLIKAARKVVSVLKPRAKQRIEHSAVSDWRK